MAGLVYLVAVVVIALSAYYWYTNNQLKSQLKDTSRLDESSSRASTSGITDEKFLDFDDDCKIRRLTSADLDVVQKMVKGKSGLPYPKDKDNKDCIKKTTAIIRPPLSPTLVSLKSKEKEEEKEISVAKVNIARLSLWDAIRKSPNIEINGKSAKMVGKTVWSNFCTAKVYPTSGFHRFKLKIIRSASRTSGFMIGIARNATTATFQNLNTFVNDKDKGYLMIYNGALLPNQRRSLASSGDVAALHGIPWKSGDSFDMNLNMDALTLSYAYNGKDLGVAFRNIAKTNYRFMVALCLQNDEVESVAIE